MYVWVLIFTAYMCKLQNNFQESVIPFTPFTMCIPEMELKLTVFVVTTKQLIEQILNDIFKTIFVICGWKFLKPY